MRERLEATRTDYSGAEEEENAEFSKRRKSDGDDDDDDVDSQSPAPNPVATTELYSEDDAEDSE